MSGYIEDDARPGQPSLASDPATVDAVIKQRPARMARMALMMSVATVYRVIADRTTSDGWRGLSSNARLSAMVRSLDVNPVVQRTQSRRG